MGLMLAAEWNFEFNRDEDSHCCRLGCFDRRCWFFMLTSTIRSQSHRNSYLY